MQALQAMRALQALQQQVGVSGSSVIKAVVISRDEQTSTVRKSQARAVLVAAAAGVAGTLLLVSLLDSFLLRRTRGALPDVREDTPSKGTYEPAHLSRSEPWDGSRDRGRALQTATPAETDAEPDLVR